MAHISHALSGTSTFADALLMDASRMLFGIGMIALGIMTLASGDFAYDWLPVSKELPARAFIARIVGTAFIGIGILLLMPHTTRLGFGALAVAFWLWELLVHVPLMIETGKNWLGAAEVLALCGGTFALLGMTSKTPRRGIANWLIGRKAIVPGRVLFALSLPVFGYSHFLYAEFASKMIPEWVPGRLFFTYLSGVGHVAAGLSLLTGVLARIAAPALCFMFGSFIAFMHIPRVLAAPGSRYEWTMLTISVLLSAAAWAIAAAAKPDNGKS
jgi:uncharacterized membrane protein